MRCSVLLLAVYHRFPVRLMGCFYRVGLQKSTVKWDEFSGGVHFAIESVCW